MTRVMLVSRHFGIIHSIYGSLLYNDCFWDISVVNALKGSGGWRLYTIHPIIQIWLRKAGIIIYGKAKRKLYK